MMIVWKLNIFRRVITSRMTAESRTTEDIIEEYTALTVEEKAEILLGI